MKDSNDLSTHSIKETKFAPLSKTRRSSLARLTQLKYRRREGVFIAEGRKIVEDLLDRGVFEPVWFGATLQYLEPHSPKILHGWSLMPESVSLCTMADLKVLSSLSTPPEVMAAFRIPAVSSDDEMPVLKDGFHLLLDGIQDPGNLGTILRTAHWFGLSKIYASHDTVDVYNQKTIQSTMGSLGSVEVVYVDLPELVKRNSHIPSVGLQLDGENLFSATLPSSALLCMGSEGHGLSLAIKELLMRSFTIPARDPGNHPESLNVAIATAITLAQFCK